MIILAIISAIAVLAFLIVLATFALRIAAVLESVGDREPSVSHQGHTSFLSKICLGVRAIDSQTRPLGSQVQQLNEQLPQLAAGLTATRDRLRNIREHLEHQKG